MDGESHSFRVRGNVARNEKSLIKSNIAKKNKIVLKIHRAYFKTEDAQLPSGFFGILLC